MKVVLTLTKLSKEQSSALTKQGWESLRGIAFDRHVSLSSAIAYNLGLNNIGIPRATKLLICYSAADNNYDRNNLLQALYLAKQNDIPLQIYNVGKQFHVCHHPAGAEVFKLYNIIRRRSESDKFMLFRNAEPAPDVKDIYDFNNEHALAKIAGGMYRHLDLTINYFDQQMSKIIYTCWASGTPTTLHYISNLSNSRKAVVFNFEVLEYADLNELYNCIPDLNVYRYESVASKGMNKGQRYSGYSRPQQQRSNANPLTAEEKSALEVLIIMYKQCPDEQVYLDSILDTISGKDLTDDDRIEYAEFLISKDAQSEQTDEVISYEQYVLNYLHRDFQADIELEDVTAPAKQYIYNDPCYNAYVQKYERDEPDDGYFTVAIPAQQKQHEYFQIF
jgi:hypothetical protein